MPVNWLRYVLLFSVNMVLVACLQTTPSEVRSPILTPSPTPIPERQLEYNLHQLPRSFVHTLKIPAQSRFVVTPALSSTLKTVEAFAETEAAIAVINGGFFDPENQKSTSSIILNGQQVAKPEDNERLMSNPNLLPYLDKILNRSEFRRYRCDGIVQYDIVLRQELPPANCQLEEALGGGPQLLPFMTLEHEGFLDTQNGQVVRDPLGSNQPNARSAIGITRDGSTIWVLAAQRSDAPNNSGLTLSELANFMKKLGVEKGMNLDGGSSAAMYYQGEVFYGKLDTAGQGSDRPVKSVLIVTSSQGLDQSTN
ncbi:MAG: phosphodiester glycosidase family protein [Oscillatoriales cyanobacterium C42_A2020_001]|nr:phosphodiester glycosidase family protein [Leptolyngbyaceae cyanobacterium C42_A2020_001]